MLTLFRYFRTVVARAALSRCEDRLASWLARRPGAVGDGHAEAAVAAVVVGAAVGAGDRGVVRDMLAVRAGAICWQVWVTHLMWTGCVGDWDDDVLDERI